MDNMEGLAIQQPRRTIWESIQGENSFVARAEGYPINQKMLLLDCSKTGVAPAFLPRTNTETMTIDWAFGRVKIPGAWDTKHFRTFISC
jgi:hypothetical protein